MARIPHRIAFLCAALCLATPLVAQSTPAALHGKRPATLAIKNVHVVRGDGAPPFGPTDVFVRDGKIVDGRIDDPSATIDGTGCWLLPGLVSTHAHLQEASAGIPMPAEYQLNLWVASGITTIRDLGSSMSRSIRLRERARRGEMPSPRILLYQSFGAAHDEDQARARVQAIRSGGADGIKFWSNFSYRADVLEAALSEARAADLRATAHIGVGESNALTYARAGITSLEHWYGIPDAALRGVQSFPPDFTYSDEVQRFRYGGRLWREADPQRLEAVLGELVERNVAWSPTLAVYEASRDLQRAQTKPEFADHLHPALQKFFAPNLDNHGSYFLGWTTTDEVYWRESYQLWMGALRRFAELGGVITTGEDAGYIYLLYGFGLIRELELQHEAGFHPLEVVKHATYHGAKVLGREREFGRILPGLSADLILVQGNPLANLKLLYPTGADVRVGDRVERSGGVRYTIREGWIWHGPTLMDEVRAVVKKARER